MARARSAPRKPSEANTMLGELGWSMLEAMPQATCICDAKGELLACNERAQQLAKRIGQGDVTVETFFNDLLKQEGKGGAVETALSEVLRTGEPVLHAWLGLRGEHGDRQMIADLTPLKGQDDSTRAVVCSFREQPFHRSAINAAGQKSVVEEHDHDELFRQLLQGLPVAVYTTDAEGDITFFNEAAARLAGRRPAAGDKWCVTWKLLHPDGTPLPHDECPMAATLRDGHARHASKVVAVRQDGNATSCEAYPTPLYDASGALVGAVNVLIDISERLGTEQALRNLNEKLEQRVKYRTSRAEAALAKLHYKEREFALLVESVLDYAIIMLDPSGNISHWNRGAERIYGYRAEDIVGRHFSSLHTPEDRASGLPEKTLAMALREGKHEIEGWRLRKNGSRFWVNAVVDPMIDNGVLLGFAKVTRDITERMESHAALVESERQARAVMDTAPDGFVQLDAIGRVVEWNPCATAMFGWSRNEALGRELVELVVPEEEWERFDDCLSLKDVATSPLVAEPLLWRARGGAPVTVELSVGKRSAMNNGRLNLFIRDIGKKLATEAQLRQSQKMEAVGLLTGGIAHDFNNLLQGIVSAIEMVDIRIKDGAMHDVGRFIDGALDSAHRASALTHRLLAFSRKQPLDVRAVDANRLTFSMGELIRRTMGEKFSVEFDLAEDLGSCLCDANQLEGALLNLSINARDAMPEGGRLILRSANIDLNESDAAEKTGVRCGPYILLSVIDTGTGMPRSVAERAFDPFFTTKAVGRGTGLGLSMVRGFVQEANGFCEIHSEEGSGTTIQLYLPRHLGQQ